MSNREQNLDISEMAQLSRLIETLLPPKGIGFMLITFPTEEPGPWNYVCGPKLAVAEVIEGLRDAADVLEANSQDANPDGPDGYEFT